MTTIGGTGGSQNRPIHLNIRQRARPGNYLLSHDGPVDAGSARHDKLDIVLDGEVINAGDEHDFETFRRWQQDYHPEWGSVLTAPRGQPSPQILHPVSKWRWLFNGKVRFSRITSGRWKATCELSLNVSRFAAYARRFGTSSVAELSEVPLHDLLRRDEQWRDELERSSLDGNDNYVPQHHSWFATVTQQWPDLVTLYADSVAAFLVQDFNFRAAAANIAQPARLILPTPSDRPPLLRRAEVYWEFIDRDALIRFRDVERTIRAAAPGFTGTTQIVVREGRQEAAHWISFDLREGVSLTVYAKTGGSLRFEISYRNMRGIDRTRSIGSMLHEDLQFSTDTSFRDRLERLRDDGSRRMNVVRTGLAALPRSPLADATGTLARLLAEIARLAQGNRALISEVISQLVADGAISAPPRSGLRRVAEGLQRAGAVHVVSVVPRPRVRRYALPDGVDLAAFLRGNGTSP